MAGLISLEIACRSFAPRLFEMVDQYFGRARGGKKRVRFALLIFETEKDGAATCISDASKADLLHALAAITIETKNKTEESS